MEGKKDQRRKDYKDQRTSNNIPEQEFRITVRRLLGGFEKIIEDTRETLPAETKDLRTSQDEFKNAITEMQTDDIITIRMRNLSSE